MLHCSTATQLVVSLLSAIYLRIIHNTFLEKQPNNKRFMFIKD